MPIVFTTLLPALNAIRYGPRSSVLTEISILRHRGRLQSREGCSSTTPTLSAGRLPRDTSTEVIAWRLLPMTVTVTDFPASTDNDKGVTDSTVTEGWR